MFSKKYRIKSSDINQIFKEKVRSNNSEDFFVKIRENDFENNRFAVIVPKKIYKTSVARHLCKRKIVSALKDIENKNSEQKTNQKFNDFVVTVRKDISNLKTSDIESQLAQILI